MVRKILVGPSSFKKSAQKTPNDFEGNVSCQQLVATQGHFGKGGVVV